MDETIPIEVKREIVARLVAVWHNTAYEAGVIFKIAKRVDDKDMMAVARANIEKAEKMRAGLEEELKALLNGEVTP